MSVDIHHKAPAAGLGDWPDQSCERCDELAGELRRLRKERNALLVRVYELEHTGRAPEPPPPPTARAPAQPAFAPPPAWTPQGAPLERPDPMDNPPPPRLDGRAPIAPLWHGGVMTRDQGLDFGAVARLSPEELDDLPYGLITLDGEGRVVHYNDTESRLVGLPRERVVGRHFFTEVAPCTRVREFEGRFRTLARDPAGVRVQSFDFAFAFAHSEQHVSIVMTPARRRGHFHLALLRRSIRAR